MYVKKGSKEKVKFLETSSHANLKLNFPVLYNLHPLVLIRGEGERRKGSKVHKHLEVKLQGQKHTNKLLSSSAECERVVHQQLHGNCSAKLTMIKILRKLVCFFHFHIKISLSETPDLSPFTINYQLH